MDNYLPSYFTGTRPEVVVHFPSNLMYGKRTAVICTAVDGDPPFTFFWLKDGMELTQMGGVTVQEAPDGYASTLFISKLEASTNGNYTCRVKNAKGVDEKHGILQVKGNSILY